MKTHGPTQSCERGEGSGSHVYAEKSTLGADELGGDVSISDGGTVTVVQDIIAPMVCTSEMGGVLSYSDGGSDMEAQVGFVPMGCTGSGADDPVTECPINGAVEVSCLSNSVDHPSFTDIVVGCSTTLVKRAEVLCHQSLLEQNRFSPIFELASDYFEEEKPLLNWVNPTGSDTDEEDWQLMDYVPLAQWDPNGGLVLMTEEDDPVAISVEDELEPSA